jgi:hypothetical protein
MSRPIIYSTNKEYRQAVRNFCNMNCSDNSFNNYEIDEESRDELLFDESSTSKKMTEIYASTKNHGLWICLYEKAAAKFFSTDNEIGLAVLLSYDYFPKLYECWTLFIESPDKFIESNEIYQNLLSAL